jgi:3-phosphoshikimate 1-carboxyvinyltransferase
MIATLHPSRIHGNIKAPASKSVAQRAIAIAALAKGKSLICQTGHADDVIAAANVCGTLHCEVKFDPSETMIKGGIKQPMKPLDCGESGLGFRMFSGIAATLSQEVVITGKGSLTQRPMNMIEDSLRAAGVFCETDNGFLPVKIKGPLPGGEVFIDGSVSSQVLTGLLIASPYAQKDTIFQVHDLKSKPYIDITIQMMQDFGVEVENNHFKTFKIRAGQKYLPRNYTVEGDWSGAAFLLVAGAIAGNVTVENLHHQSFQADRAVLDALLKAKADIQIFPNHISINRSELIAFDFDATHCPDLFPPLVALAAACKGITKIKGVSRLKVKESDRAHALQKEFGKMGIEILIRDDVMLIQGGDIEGATIHSHHDHRIAMAGAVAALIAKDKMVIQDAKAVNKSYPDFFQDIRELGANVFIQKNA